ncbi:MAG: T9SS type A sorting domain-containing protein [bacterium]|nr:T9SS type A sorting domain-containing protein [bacterium]
MKNNNPKYIAHILFVILLLQVSVCLSQVTPWNPVKTFTSGFNDRNPSFGNKVEPVGYAYHWEFLIFERMVNDSVSQICVLKIGLKGVMDSVFYLTSNLNKKRNASISYNNGYNFGGIPITNSLALWEEEVDDNWKVMGRYYHIDSWGDPFIIDSSVNNASANSVHTDSSKFILVYQKNSDIILKKINALNEIITIDTNLTTYQNNDCKNPRISKAYFIYISYERKKNTGDYAIDLITSGGLPVLNYRDTVAYEGNNINYGFSVQWGVEFMIFGSNRSGNYNFYSTEIGTSPFHQNLFISYNASDLYDFNSYNFPFVFNRNGQDYFSYASCFIKKDSDTQKIIFGNYNLITDSTVLGDTGINFNVTLNNGLKINQGDVFLWAVFNKDSAGYSGLYGRSNLIITGNIVRTGNEIPNSITLHQNYPNPFNPITKIKFDVPGNTADVRLIIYDQLGKEVELLFDKKLSGGSYEATWNAGDLPSGVYFYKLISGDLSITKKLMLIK